MSIRWDVEIPLMDGRVVYADVFAPVESGRYPVILSHGVYGKGVPVAQVRARLAALAGSMPQVSTSDVAELTAGPDEDEETGADDFRVWEVVDPVRWVPRGYVCVRIDSRGTGSSPGYLDPVAPDEIDDFAACIEWAGTQEWSNGRVGLRGKSYYALTQWLVAARRPAHLAALCVWHGLSDWYRDATRHGGIMYEFWERFWYPQLALPVQHGVGPAAGLNPHSGRSVAGSERLSDAELDAHRTDIGADIRAHRLDDAYFQARTPDLSKIEVPVFAAADWSDQDLHLRGTIRGLQHSRAPQKWLEIHAGGEFDDEHAVGLQQRFFDHVLKGGTGDWDEQPRVQVEVRHPDGRTRTVKADRWPLPGTEWRELYLRPAERTLTRTPEGSAATARYDATGEGLTFVSDPWPEDVLLAGPVAGTVWISASTADTDLFLTLEALAPDGGTVMLRDHRGGPTSLSVGWLRASHRALDDERSTATEPFHRHTAEDPLTPGDIYELTVELRPTSLDLPAGYRLALRVAGNGPVHDDPDDRPADVFGGEVTLHGGPQTPSRLLIPIVTTPGGSGDACLDGRPVRPGARSPAARGSG